MIGAFASHAAKYAELGYSVIPVGLDKKPLMTFRGNRPLGANAIDKLADQFPDAQLGLRMQQSGIVAMDGDDRSLLSEVMQHSGHTPFRAWTRRGFHAVYRESGESRRLRIGGRKLDLIAGNNLIVVPPSNPYSFMNGAELVPPSELPPLRPGAVEALSGQSAQSLLGGLRDGDGREVALFDGMREFAGTSPHSVDLTTLQAWGAAWVAERCRDPLPPSAIDKTAKSVMLMIEEGRLFVKGQRNGTFLPDGLLERLSFDGDAVVLLTVLKGAWGASRDSSFPVSPKAMERDGTIPGWYARRYKRARDQLVAAGELRAVHQGTGKGDPSLFAWPRIGGRFDPLNNNTPSLSPQTDGFQ